MGNFKEIFLMVMGMMFFCGCERSVMEERSEEFISSHVEKVRPMFIEAGLANWKAAGSGKDEDYDKFSQIQLEIRKVYSDRREFASLKEMVESGEVKDALLSRQVNSLYNGYLENQIEPELMEKIVKLGTEIEKNFSVFRGAIGDRKVNPNEIKEILKTEIDPRKRKDAWLASKQVGPEVAEDIIRLVKLRNESARAIGFDNFHTLSLTVSEQDVKELDKIFEELNELTRAPFRELKDELDGILAGMYGVGRNEVMPWHYHDPFFQEGPMVYDLDFDVYYEDKDVKELTAEFFDGIGLSIDDVIERSDLYEREGKNPHAFCIDIDREGDVRMLCNIKNNEQWMGTMLHESGHAVYDKYHDPDVPYLLREPAHIFTTEAIAMFFGRMSSDPVWMQEMLGLSDGQRGEIERVSEKSARLRQLVFARWVLVMYNFEKQLYADPDQDLNGLWWEMVERYQFVNKPAGRDEPDWAAKIHFAIAPCYYHNYMLGELLASQLHRYFIEEVMSLDSDDGFSYVGQKKAGEFLRKNVFEVGSVYYWNEMIERATGEKLTAKYFVNEFVK